MSQPPRKTPFDLLARFLPKATAEDEAEARRLGADVDTYRATKWEVEVGQARREAADASDEPPDIRAEEAAARQQRRDPGFIKPRNTAPSIFVQAAKTPGEVARTILFVMLYVIGLCAVVIVGGERVQKMPGIFQCVLLGLLIIPVWWTTNRIWEAIGERARDVIRALIRFWPVTLIVGFFAVVLLVALFRR